MKVTFSGRTDVGRTRERNEDSLVVDPRIQFGLVCDGVGGGNAGNVASSMASQIIHESMTEVHDRLDVDSNPDPDRVRHVLTEGFATAINRASEAVFDRGQSDPSCRGMATTAVGIQVVGSVGAIGHVGDSRLYLIRGGGIYQMTQDHTLVQELIRVGKLTPEEAAAYPHRNVIARSVGLQPAVQADTLLVDVIQGDRFVLCSDGLCDLLSADEIKDVVLQMAPDDATAVLIDKANERAGHDNITVIVAEAGGVQTAKPQLRTEQKADLIRSVFLFSDLSFQEVMRVLPVVTERRYSHGETIIREGETGDEIFIVVEGEAEVTQNGVFLTRVPTGGHFGEQALIAEGVRSASVTSVGDSVHLTLAKDDFYRLVSADHDLAVKLLWRFLQTVGNRMRSLSSELTQLRRNMGG